MVAANNEATEQRVPNNGQVKVITSSSSFLPPV
jgi:hypothetical protein